MGAATKPLSMRPMDGTSHFPADPKRASASPSPGGRDHAPSPSRTETERSGVAPDEAGWKQGLRDLHPAYFSLVMATGIVSIAAFWTGFGTIAAWLFGLNIGAYGVLLMMFAARIALYPQAVWKDLSNHARSVGFFTSIAATCVLGSQFVLIGGRGDMALGLWILGLGFWGILIYGIFTILTVLPEKPTLDKGINGAWLVAVVAAQSLTILGAQLSHQFFCLVMWLGGGMLYVWLISLIFYRYTFFQMKAADLAPPYWINMGAAAISTLAGAQLISQSDSSPILTAMLPFVQGVTVTFWATATWWIPMLLTLGVWRHIYCRFPLRYDPLYWGAVFPLGMYTVCTHRLSAVLDASFLETIPKYFVYVAFAAWTLAFVGLLHSLLQQASSSRQTGLPFSEP